MATPSLLRDPTYVSFRESCPLLQVSFGSSPARDWSFFSSSEKSPHQIPIICIPGIVTTAESFFFIHSALSSSGYRVVSINYPPASSCREWAVNLFEYLQFLDIKKCHLLGCDLGGYFALWFAKTFPDSVDSIILCNSFVSTDWICRKLKMTIMLSMLPMFILKQLALDLFGTILGDDRTLSSMDFVSDKLNSFPRSDLLTRLQLVLSPVPLNELAGINQGNITVMQTLDDSLTDIDLYKQTQACLPRAKFAELKDGGDFPILSRPEQIILHLRIHLRRFSNTFVDRPTPRHKPHSSSVSVESTTKNESRRERRHSQPLLFRCDELNQDPFWTQSSQSVISGTSTECNSIPLPPAVFVKKPLNLEREARKRKLFELATSRDLGAV